MQSTLSRILPEDIWKMVLECVDPKEYFALTRQAAGVSREFYWLLKNSVITIRVHRPVVPLCGVVWLHSRDRHFSHIKNVEGEPLHWTFFFLFLLLWHFFMRKLIPMLFFAVLARSLVFCQGGGFARNLSVCWECEEAPYQSDYPPQIQEVQWEVLW